MVKLLRVALPVEQLRCRRIILRRPQSTCVRLELHCVQPLHLPEIKRLLLLAVSAESSPFQKHLRRTGLSARQAEMTASRQVDGVCPGVKAEFCLRPLLALRRKLAHPVPQLKQKARPVFRLVKRLPGRLDMKRPQHLLKRHPAPLSGADDCSQQFFQQNDFRRTEAMSAVMHRLPEQLIFFPAPQDQNVIGREGLRYRIQNLFSRLCCFQYRDVVVNSIFCPLRQGAHVVQMGVASVPRHSIRAVRLTADRKNIARNGHFGPGIPHERHKQALHFYRPFLWPCSLLPPILQIICPIKLSFEIFCSKNALDPAIQGIAVVFLKFQPA